MTLDNASIIADATAGIADVGFPVAFTRTTNWPSTPDQNIETGAPDTTMTAVAIKTSRAFLSNGQEIQAAKTLLVAAGIFVPQQGDRATIGGVDMTVVRVGEISPGGVALLFRIDLAS